MAGNREQQGGCVGVWRGGGAQAERTHRTPDLEPPKASETISPRRHHASLNPKRERWPKFYNPKELKGQDFDLEVTDPDRDANPNPIQYLKHSSME